MKKLVLTVAAISLAGCATPRGYNLIDAEARPELNSMESVLLVKQSELGSAIETSNISAATGGGLIPALIDAGVNANRTKTAEEMISPIRDKMIDFDFPAQLESDIEAALADIGIEGITEVELVRAEDRTYRQDTVAETSADAVMFIDSTYQLSPNFDMVVVTANVTVYPKSPALNAFKERFDEDEKYVEFTDNIFKFTFMQTASLGGSPTKEYREGNAQRIIEMPVEELTAVFVEASEKIAKDIATELQRDDDEPVSAKD